MQAGVRSREPVASRRRVAHAVAEAIRGRHVRTWILAVLTISVVGALGYVALFGWPATDALYMTVITLTTVGFREVQELDTFGEQLWTMLLAVAGVGIIFGSIGIVAETIISEAASGRREARRMREAVGELRDHYIVCGYGRVGSTVIRELLHTGQRFVVIDVNAPSLERAAADGHLVVMGDATDDATLRTAGIERARGLITTIDSDANNVYVTLSARALSPDLFIVARASAVGAEAKLAQAGANRIVSPYTMAGRRIAELAVRPRVADYIDAALSHGNLSFSLEEVEVDAASPLLGVTVGRLRADGVVALAILQPDGAYEANPPEARELREGESLIASGSTEALAGLRARA
jgi:voltage-gated potassium channel